jgi:diadenosine tetraphosphate (Ap4A) HIT family hydrolase
MQRIDERFVVLRTAHWTVNHRTDATLAGYLVVAANDESATSLADLSASALADLGPVLARVTRAVERVLAPEHVYVCRFGHSPGWPLHFHVVPVHRWLVDRLMADPAYDAVRRLSECGRLTVPDGADLTLYVMREWTTAEGRAPPRPSGPSVEDVIGLLRGSLS